jgi:hypothetical protein
VGANMSTSLASFTEGIVKDFAGSIGKSIEKTLSLADK